MPLLHELFPPSVRLPLELGADAAILLTSAAVLFILTRYRKWGWLWHEWLTTSDHKRIGIMYIIAAITMLFRGGVDALLMRAQLALPDNNFLSAAHYDAIFTTHGTIMIFFMAMPLMFGLFNIAIPLMIGARDVAFPRLNAISLWLFIFGALLFNISFVIGGSPNAGWTSYPPLAERLFDPGVGENYYLLSLQISGLGSIASGINFLVTILRMRAPGMHLMRMPLFCWSALVASVLIVFAFPALTAVLGFLMLDRLLGTAFFTLSRGGLAMMYVNFFWLWGHPEVYILVLPAFGIFSEVVATFSGKRLFGYGAMVGSLLAITLLSFGVWVHHFFTMGAGPTVNAFFGISTMLIAVPTGVKVFNWIFTMWGGKVRLTVPMLWQLAFIPTFIIGGASGVLLGAVPADYQLHNTYFLIAHFHNVLIGGVVFGFFSGLYYWWPKMFGYTLNERQGRWAFWLFFIGFWVCFLPQYLLGLEGMTRRMFTYPAGLGWTPLNQISTIGAFIMGAGFIALVYNILQSMRHPEWDTTGDPWDGRTLEWSLPSPAPEYNFARIPEVGERDAWWAAKRDGRAAEVSHVRPGEVQAIEVPRHSAIPFLLGFSFFVVGVGLVYGSATIALVGLAGVLACLFAGWWETHPHQVLPPEEILHIEGRSGRVQG